MIRDRREYELEVRIELAGIETGMGVEVKMGVEAGIGTEVVKGFRCE